MQKSLTLLFKSCPIFFLPLPHPQSILLAFNFFSASFYLLLQLSPQPKYDERLVCVLFLWLTKANRLFVFLFSVTAESAVQEPAVWRSRCLSCLPALCSNHQKFQIRLLLPFWRQCFWSSYHFVLSTCFENTVDLFLSHFQWLPVQGPVVHNFQAPLWCSLTGSLFFSNPVLFLPC